MWVWVDRLGGFVLDAGTAAVVLWAVAALAMLGCRQPSRRLRLARAAMVGSLALFPLIGLDLVPRFDLFAAIRGVGSFPHPPAPPHWPARVLTLVYLSGVACGLGWLALGCAALVWLPRRSRAPSEETQALYEALPYSSAGRRPRLLVADRVRRPGLVGALRPSILIPAELGRPEARDRLQLTLLHELAHAEGGDPGFGLLGNLVQAFWFFVPPLWWVAAQVRLDQEYLADRRAAAGFGPLGGYVSSLLDLASTRAEPPGPSPGGPAAFKGPGSPLFQRVLMLLRCPFPVEPTPPAWWSWLIPCLAVLVTLGASSLTVQPPPATAVGPRRTHTFRMAWLDLAAAPPGLHDRAPLYELPIRLPEHFDLTTEVWDDLPTLSRMRVVGLGLELNPGKPPLNATPDLATWHLVRIRRDRDGVRLWIDGRRADAGRNARGLTSWLSVEPAPDRPASYQRLTLTWSNPP